MFKKLTTSKKAMLSVLSTLSGVFYFLVLAIVQIIALAVGSGLNVFTTHWSIIPIGALLLGGDKFVAIISETLVDIARAKYFIKEEKVND